MGRSPCCEKVGLKKGPWTPEEDQKLMSYIEKHGHGSWRALPSKAGLQRCGKSCRLRWTNYLRPDIKRGKFSLQEEQTIIQLHALLGNRWSAIAAQLPKRTDNEIKNYWNTHLKKRLTRMGIDPTTHKPKTDAIAGGSAATSTSQSKDVANLSHMAQWENARLEAEARLVRESKLLLQVQQAQQTNTTQPPPPARLVLNKITATHQQPMLPPCLDVLKAWQNSWSSKPQLSVPAKENFKMQSMYAMMLSTDENLESPTSTLCFPGGSGGGMLPMISSSTTTVVDVLNENLLTPSLSKTKIDSNSSTVTPCHEGVFITKGGSSNNNNGTESSSWYLNNNPETELDDDEIVENNNNNENNNKFRDDDIMVAVEAFRGIGGASGGGAYQHGVNVVPPSTSDVVVMEAGVISTNNNNGDDDDGHMPYDSIINDGDGSICNVSLEENKHYWNAILSLVNDSQLMF